MLISKNILKGWLFIYFVLSLLILPKSSFAATFTVTPASDGDCVDFNCNLQAALTAASSNNQNDTINIAAGTYNTAGTTFTYTTGAMENFDLTLDGAGAGVTILDGGNADQVLRIVTTVVMPNDSGVDTFIRDLTIRNGMGVFATADGNGGGLRFSATSADLTVQNCTFSNNTTNGDGGGLFSSTSGVATITNGTFNNNTAVNPALAADPDGGGAFFNSGPVSITNTNFTNNSATSDGGGVGVLNLVGNLTLTDNTFTNNTAVNGDGGGFATLFTGAVQLNNATLTDNNFTDNSAGDDGGGAIVNANLNVTATDNTFTDNTAGGEGGGLIAGSGSPDDANLSNNTFTNNSAEGDGGGAKVSADADVIATDNTFTDNSAGGDGGGLLTEAQNVTLDVNEFDNNTADANGGGASADADADVNAMGNTFSNNSADGEGGGSLIVAENVTLDANEFASNIAAAYGGGLHASVANNAILTNHIFIDNSSDVNGGGADITADDATLTNNTFTLNSTLGDGGGLNLNINDATSANIFNNIIFNNSATGDGGDIFVDDDFNNNLIGSTVNLFNNDFSDFFSVCENTVGCTANINEASNIDADPLFVNAAAGNVHLTANSPAIDLGSPTAPDLPATDFDGNPRIIGPAPDMGALEFTGPSTIDVTIVKSSDLSEVTEGRRVEITYTIILKNTGTQSATGITVQEPLPSGASLEEASLGCTENVPGTVICSVGTLGSAAEVTLTITISITPRGAEILNQAILRFLGAGGVTVEKNSNTVMITVEESGNGCSLASGPVHFETAAANFLILLIPGFVVGIRILRRRTKKNYS